MKINLCNKDFHSGMEGLLRKQKGNKERKNYILGESYHKGSSTKNNLPLLRLKLRKKSCIEKMTKFFRERG